MCLCNIESPVEFVNMTSNEDQRDQQKECGCYGPFGLHSIACIHAVHNRQPSVREIVEGKAELDAALDEISDETLIKAGKAAVRLEEGLERLAKVKLARLAVWDEMFSSVEIRVALHVRDCGCPECNLYRRLVPLALWRLP